MKKALALLLLTALPQLQAQTLENLKIQTKQLYDANYHMDFEPLAELTYPAVVTQLGGKIKFLEQVDQDYQNSNYRRRLQLVAPTFNYGAISNVGDAKVCVIDYRNPTRFFFEKKLDPTSGLKTANDLKASEQATETIYEPKRNTINVKKISKIIAISDESTKGFWRFINLDDPDQIKAAQAVLNENLKKELGLSTGAK